MFVFGIRCQLFCQTIISLMFTIECEVKVRGRCGKPGLPPQASLWHISPEKSRFDDSEKVLTVCKKNEFPQHRLERQCRNGRWTGQAARCGRHIHAQVIHLDIYDCKAPDHRVLASQAMNMSADAPEQYGPLRPNAFHNLRAPVDAVISATESTCYEWKVRFDKKVQIWYLLVDIWYKNDNNTEIPTLTPTVSKYRTCSLAHNTTHLVSTDKVVGYYFYCDLNTESDAKSELNDLFDTISVHINTSVVKEIALEAVFIGDLFTTSVDNKVVKPDCGQFEIKSIGVDLQSEQGLVYIACNDSFIDMNGQGIALMSRASGNPKHILRCNSNGQWVGDWPVCYPKIVCPLKELMDAKDISVDIEEFGNVYHYNDSTQWFAINYTFVKYKCNEENALLVGNHIRNCMKDGTWDGPNPHCFITNQSHSNANSYTIISILIAFVLIILLIITMKFRQMKNELKETRLEMQMSLRSVHDTASMVSSIDTADGDKRMTRANQFDYVPLVRNPIYETEY